MGVSQSMQNLTEYGYPHHDRSGPLGREPIAPGDRARFNLGIASQNGNNNNITNSGPKSLPTNGTYTSTECLPTAGLASSMPVYVASSMPAVNIAADQKEVETLRTEVKMLRRELMKCRETIKQLQEREKTLRDRLSEQAQKQISKSSKFEDLNQGESRPSMLVRRYENLYSQARVDAYDALDANPEMSEFDDLKGKLLFSVVVLAFRSVQQSIRQLHHKLRRLLHLPDTRGSASSDPLAKSLGEAVEEYLRRTVDTYNCSSNVEEVCNQVWATLYDYPGLKNCSALRNYIEECVRLAWALSVQNPPMVIDYETKVSFNPDMHERFHTSDPDSNQVHDVLWPALLDSEAGHCVYKGVVVT